MDLTDRQLLDLALDAAESALDSVPSGLEASILDRSITTLRPPRHQGWDGDDGHRLSSLSAFIRTASELGDLLDTLTADELAAATRLPGAAVHDIVEHLVGVERYVLGQLGRRPRLDAPTREQHWAIAKQAATMVDEPGATVAAVWWQEVLDLITACSELGPDHPVAYHHLGGPLSGLLVVRTFELWTHGDDIRQATRRPLNLLDEDRLSLMVGELMTVLPLGLALSGVMQPGRTARIHLTGIGAGTFDVALAPGEEPGEPDIILTTDAIAMCRLAANRVAPDQLVVNVEGNHALLDAVLVGATAFAAD